MPCNSRCRKVVRDLKRSSSKHPDYCSKNFVEFKDSIDSRTSDVLKDKELDEELKRCVGTYLLPGNKGWQSEPERKAVFFLSLEQVSQFAKAESLFTDIDYTCCETFPYLLNIVCHSSELKGYIAVARSF